MAQLTLYLDQDTLRKVENAAAGGNVSVSKWVRDRIETEFEEPQDLDFTTDVRRAEYGAAKSSEGKKVIRRLREFIRPLQIIAFDSTSAMAYGTIRAELESTGRVIGPNDLIVEATTLGQAGTPVTHNVKEFSAVFGLRLEDWTG